MGRYSTTRQITRKQGMPKSPAPKLLAITVGYAMCFVRPLPCSVGDTVDPYCPTNSMRRGFLCPSFARRFPEQLLFGGRCICAMCTKMARRICGFDHFSCRLPRLTLLVSVEIVPH